MEHLLFLPGKLINNGLEPLFFFCAFCVRWMLGVFFDDRSVNPTEICRENDMPRCSQGEVVHSMEDVFLVKIS